AGSSQRWRPFRRRCRSVHRLRCSSGCAIGCSSIGEGSRTASLRDPGINQSRPGLVIPAGPSTGYCGVSLARSARLVGYAGCNGGDSRSPPHNGQTSSPNRSPRAGASDWGVLMKRQIVCVVIALLGAITTRTVTASAQTLQSGTIGGVVKDTSGGVLP